MKTVIAILSYASSSAGLLLGILAVSYQGTLLGGLFAGLGCIAFFGGFGFGMIARA